VTGAEAVLRARIAAEGPVSVADFMAIALGDPEHGYYRTRDPLGAAGDFTTAPEISQMFGELVGLWLGQAWLDQGSPAPFVLAELGPGRGTLMADALRALDAVPGFLPGMDLRLVETSPVLRAAQAARLGRFAPRWIERVDDLPDGPLFAVANEFFDALPIRQHRRADPGWQERLVGIDGAALAFGFGPLHMDPRLDARFPLLPDGALVEVCEPGEAAARALGGRIAAGGGAALVIDYGAWDGTGDTLQAVRAHAPCPPLLDPGLADLTAHVRFGALAEAARPAAARGPVPLGIFLERLGITVRAERLATGADHAQRAAIALQHRRLTHPAEMGNLFRVLALVPDYARPPPGFD
jgi:SAM-dependent MidA family methyltransferase